MLKPLINKLKELTLAELLVIFSVTGIVASIFLLVLLKFSIGFYLIYKIFSIIPVQ